MILRGKLRGKVGRRRDKYERPSGKLEGLFLFPYRRAKIANSVDSIKYRSFHE